MSVRSPEDLADVNRAVALLMADQRTDAVGLRLFKEHGNAKNAPVPGWKFLEAVPKLQDRRSDQEAGSFGYFCATARNIPDRPDPAAGTAAGASEPAPALPAEDRHQLRRRVLAESFEARHREARRRLGLDEDDEHGR